MQQNVIGIKHPVHSMDSTSNSHIPIFTAIKSLIYAKIAQMYNQTVKLYVFMFY